MKKKLLVLSASAILASNFVFDNSASAVVRNTEHESEALKMHNNEKPSLAPKQVSYYAGSNYSPKQYIYYGSNSVTQKQYEKQFKELTHGLSLNEHGGYDEIEYQEAYQKYQDRFLGELDAFNKLILNLDSSKGEMTPEKYNKIRESLKKNREEFDSNVKNIENRYDSLKRFDDDELNKALDKVYELEDKALMVRRAFQGDQYRYARYQLINKLYLIVGSNYDERLAKLPTNKRMLNEMCENLESVIDEFFKDIELERPKNIDRLTKHNQEDEKVLKKVREDALKATYDESQRDPGVKERAEKLEKANKKAKEEREAKAKVQKEKGLLRDKEFSARNYPLYFPHKKLNNNSKEKTTSEKKLVFKEVNENTNHYPVFTQTITSTPQPVLKQEKREEIVTPAMAPRFNQNNTLKGMEGESAPVTVVSEPAIKTTSAPQQKVVEGNTGFSGSNNNLSSMGGESKEVSFTYDSQPVDFDIITESNEIVLDQHTDIKVSGYTTGESIEDSHVSNEVTK